MTKEWETKMPTKKNLGFLSFHSFLLPMAMKEDKAEGQQAGDEERLVGVVSFADGDERRQSRAQTSRRGGALSSAAAGASLRVWKVALFAWLPEIWARCAANAEGGKEFIAPFWAKHLGFPPDGRDPERHFCG